MPDFKLLSDDEKTKLADCSKLSGCEMVRCLGHDIPACGGTWDVSQPSRGLGDTVAKITHATGIAAGVKAVTTAMGIDCGCGKRQDTLNKLIPFQGN